MIDLGLKRTTRAYGIERLERGVTRSAHGELANSELRTSDERRALLGCFYLTTMYAPVIRVSVTHTDMYVQRVSVDEAI